MPEDTEGVLRAVQPRVFPSPVPQIPLGVEAIRISSLTAAPTRSAATSPPLPRPPAAAPQPPVPGAVSLQTPHLSPPPGTQLLQGQAAWCRGTGSSLHLCEANAIFTRRTGGSSDIVLHRCQPPSSEQGHAGGVAVTPQPPPSHSSRRDETPAPACSCRKGSDAVSWSACCSAIQTAIKNLH